MELKKDSIILYYYYHVSLSSVFGCVERKWKERKLRKSMEESGLTLNSSSFIGFLNFLSFYFLSFKPNNRKKIGGGKTG
jgi:hypothetical protein